MKYYATFVEQDEHINSPGLNLFPQFDQALVLYLAGFPSHALFSETVAPIDMKLGRTVGTVNPHEYSELHWMNVGLRKKTDYFKDPFSGITQTKNLEEKL